MHERRKLRTLIALACLAVTGCSADADPEGPSVKLSVTSEFGRETVESNDEARLKGRRTMLRLLRDNTDVAVADGGYYIEAIEGLRSEPDREDDRATTWASNVNGIETDVLPGEYRLYRGDVVQFDLRDWYVRYDVRATVGAFPETFTRGVFGRRFPVTVRCQKPSSTPCRRVKQALRRAGVPLDGSRAGDEPLPERGNPRRAKVLVGTWSHLRNGHWAKRVDRGPAYSGIFGRFSRDGRSLRLFDWDGHSVRQARAGTGLVGAMRPTEEDLVWYVTGVDDEGVDRAARALDSDALHDAFSVAITDTGVEKLPLPPEESEGP